MNTGILIGWAISASRIVCSIALILPFCIGAVGDEVFTTYDLVSRGTNTSGTNQCWGTYDSTTTEGWGPGYQYACIHSGIISASDIATTWYNYTLATAGTIIDENTSSSSPATNTAKATESICPKGWALPSKAQADSNRNVTLFSPVPGGFYDYGTLNNEDARGYWWGSEANGGANRYFLGYNGSSLYTSNDGRRRVGFYIRCIQAS